MERDLRSARAAPERFNSERGNESRAEIPAAVRDRDAFQPGRDVFLPYYRSLGVSAFNVALAMPPLEPVRGEDWSDFPVIARIVDRGNPAVRRNETAALERYAQSTSADDPFVTASELRAFKM